MTFITKRIEPTSSGLHVRYFVPNDPPDVKRDSDINWTEVVAIAGGRLQFDQDGPTFRQLNIYQDGGASEDFIDAPSVEGWLDLVDAMQSTLDITTRDWLDRLTSMAPQPLWSRDHHHLEKLLVYQRDGRLPDLLTQECEICGSSIDWIT